MLRNIAVGKFFLFGMLVFLLQSVLVAPLPATNDAQNDDSATQPRVVTPARRALKLYALGNFTESYNLRLQNSIQMVEAVLADASIADVNTEDMAKAKRFLRKFVKRAKSALEVVLPAEKIDDDDAHLNVAMEKAIVLAEFGDYARSQNVTGVSDVSKEQQLLWDALLKQGWVEPMIEMNRYMNNFYPKFADDVLNYVASLSPAEKQSEEILGKAYDYYHEHSEEITKTQFGKRTYSFIMDENAKKGPSK